MDKMENTMEESTMESLYLLSSQGILQSKYQCVSDHHQFY